MEHSNCVIDITENRFDEMQTVERYCVPLQIKKTQTKNLLMQGATTTHNAFLRSCPTCNTTPFSVSDMMVT